MSSTEVSDQDVSDQTLAAARTAAHGLAEHVLAVAGRAATGSIRLYVRDGGLGTPDLDGDGTRIVLVEGRLVRHPHGPELPFRGTLGELASALGVPFGLTDPPYHLSSGCGPEHVVDVDPAALELVLDAWRVGHDALRRFAPAAAPVVWPEHLDVAIESGAVNYGVSPGDGFEPRPYAYVGPHQPRTGPFWNAPFGAARRLSELAGVDGVVGFFHQGAAQAG